MPGAGPIKCESLRVGCGHWERRKALRVLMCRWSGELLPYTICPITSLSSSPTTSPFSLYSLHSNWTGLFTVLEYTRNAPASGPLPETSFLRRLNGLAASFPWSLTLTWRHALLTRSLPCLELQSLSPCQHALSSTLLYVFFFSTSIIWHFTYVYMYVFMYLLYISLL